MPTAASLDSDLRWGLAIALLIMVVFAVVIVTTVDDRAEIGEDFRSSFHEKAVASFQAMPGGSLDSSCEETEPRNFACAVKIADRSESELVGYEVTLRDSGCWTARLEPGGNPTTLPPRLRACIGGTR